MDNSARREQDATQIIRGGIARAKAREERTSERAAAVVESARRTQHETRDRAHSLAPHACASGAAECADDDPEACDACRATRS